MGKIERFEDIQAWQKAKELKREIPVALRKFSSCKRLFSQRSNSYGFSFNNDK